MFVRYNDRLFKVVFVDTNNNMGNFDERAVVYAFDKESCKWNAIIDKSYVESVAGRTWTGKEPGIDVSEFFHYAMRAIEEVF